MNRYALVPTCLLCVLFVVTAPLFWIRAQTGDVPPGAMRQDEELYQRVYPQYTYVFGRLRAVDLPQWNPAQLCGVPVTAMPGASPAQPLNWVFLFFPTSDALALHGFICLCAMGLFAALFARAMNLSYLAAAVAGLAYAFGGSASVFVSRPEAAAVMVWLPFAGWMLREHARRPGPAMALAVGAALALLVLAYAAGPFVAAMAFLIPYAGALLSLGPEDELEPQTRRVWPQMAGLAAALVVGLGLSATVWLPMAAHLAEGRLTWQEVLRCAPRGVAPAGLHDFVQQLFSARPGKLPRIGYVGIAPLLLAPVALFHTRRRGAVLFLGVFLFGFVAMSLVRPPVDAFPFPFRVFTIPMSLCLALLAAIGTDRLFAQPFREECRGLWGPVILFVVIAGLLFYGSNSNVRGRIVPLLALVLFFALVHTPRTATVVGVLLATLVFADLAAATASRIAHPFQDAPACYRTRARALDLADDRALGGRAAIWAHRHDTGLAANAGMLGALRVAGGAHIGLSPEQRVWWESIAPAQDAPPDLRDPVVLRLLRLMGVRVGLAGPATPVAVENSETVRELDSVDETQVVLFQQAMPRAWWVPEYEKVRDIRQALDHLRRPDFDMTRQCVIEGVTPYLRRAPVVQPGSFKPYTADDATCVVVEESPEELVVRVDTPASGMLILSDTFAPGWQAWLDGRPASLLRGNGVFRAVAVPAGQHEVAFHYRQESMDRAVAMTALALVVTATIGFWGRRKRRPRG